MLGPLIVCFIRLTVHKCHLRMCKCPALFDYLLTSTLVLMGACGLVDRTSDSRLKRSGVWFHCWSCVKVSNKFSFHVASYPPSSDGWKLWAQAASIFVILHISVYSQGRWDCSSGVCPIWGKIMAFWIWYRQQNLNYVPSSFYLYNEVHEIE